MKVVLAAGAWIKPNGYLRHRVVLRAEVNDEGFPTEFIVHHQAIQENDYVSYSNGSYFPVHSYGKGASAAMTAFEKAYACFQQRDKEKVLGLDFNSIFRDGVKPINLTVPKIAEAS